MELPTITTSDSTAINYAFTAGNAFTSGTSTFTDVDPGVFGGDEFLNSAWRLSTGFFGSEGSKGASGHSGYSGLSGAKYMSNRRIVQVYIADPNENVPLDKALLYQDAKPRITDLTDQELFFDIDIKSILDKYNDYRVTVKDKEASEGKANDVLLEKARIRDLRMTVVVVAQF